MGCGASSPVNKKQYENIRGLDFIVENIRLELSNVRTSETNLHENYSIALRFTPDTVPCLIFTFAKRA